MGFTLLEVAKAFAFQQLNRAKQFADKIPFTEKSLRNEAMTKEAFSIRASAAADPDFAELELSDGISVWASILSVDLRDSTELADSISPRDMYLTIHTLLPTLAFVCDQSGGRVMNFRGDGLFSLFGMKKIRKGDPDPSQLEIKFANQQAVCCGLYLIETVKSAVEVVLSEDGIKIDLHAGVGIDCGRATVTRVGWMAMGELTAYGSCVNNACNLSSARDLVLVSRRVTENYPCSDQGKLVFDGRGGSEFAVLLEEKLLT